MNTAMTDKDLCTALDTIMDCFGNCDSAAMEAIREDQPFLHYAIKHHEDIGANTLAIVFSMVAHHDELLGFYCEQTDELDQMEETVGDLERAFDTIQELGASQTIEAGRHLEAAIDELKSGIDDLGQAISRYSNPEDWCLHEDIDDILANIEAIQQLLEDAEIRFSHRTVKILTALFGG